ncbi:MAG TPA: hypothetical protein VNK06_09080, partial [Thermodesulfobacteriota bacterium]|nr:hypothetical protein [Thermodesulfobacteriota bacterium]
LVRRSIEEFVFLKRRYPGGEKALKIKGLVTASIGIASLKASVESSSTVKDVREKIIKLADSAMYKSKQSGKNMVTLSIKEPVRTAP